MKAKERLAAFALMNGLVTHIGTFDGIDDAAEAIKAWREDIQHNRAAAWCYITPIIEA